MKFLFVLFSFLIISQKVALDTVREAYPNASLSKNAAVKFAALVENSAADPVISGYRHASKIILAKFEAGPNRKKWLTSGISGLEKEISGNPKNLELRLIRLSLQENLPKIVSYNSNIKEDKSFILQNYPSQNQQLKQYVRSFSARSKSFTPSEKSALK